MTNAERMRVYYDNVIASGLVTGRMWPNEEREALLEVEAFFARGHIHRVTSRESWREQDRTTSAERREQLHSARDLLSVVQGDHRVLNFSNITGPLGTVVTNPLVTDIVDEEMFDNLRNLGLNDADARHFMYAFTNTCQRFVTVDTDFLSRRSELDARWPPLRVVRPSELAEELQRKFGSA